MITINGKMYDWADLTIIYPGSVPTGIIGVGSIDWNEEQEVEPIYGAGNKPIGFGTGNWKAEGKMTITLEAYSQLNLLTKNGIFNASPFNIVLVFANEFEPLHSVKLIGCKWTKKSNKASQGDKKMEVELDFVILEDIKHDSVSASEGE
ncbi:hypothetical protein [Thermospira aquatica]|uniref:Phage tail protein n=1 Tax=Thermospira aquatica TaxID=2828656 RepID=A0AAX3BDY3_9SPIR|nr:hypothetical protein [Thermospira aquatica]URA10537.1 hypothetical protein KDW03_01675 [Thermospira aquatica]